MPDNSEILRKAKEALDKAVDTERRNRELLRSIGPAIIEALKPTLEAIEGAVSRIKVDVQPRIEVNPEVRIPEIRVPDVIVPGIEVPQPKVTVNVPPIRIPEIKMPEEMDIKGWVRLQGVDLDHPLPVQLRDADGKPVNLFENLTTLVSGGGGAGKADYFTIKGYSQSAFAELMNPDGRVKVELPSGSTGLTDTELRASSVPVAQASGANWSVYVTGSNGSVAATILNGDGNSLDPRDRNWTITETVPISAGATLDTKQVSGAIDSVNVLQWAGNALAKGTELNDGVLRVVHVTDVGLSTNATIQGTPTVTVSGSISSVVAVGDIVSDAVDDNSAPVKIGGIARTANPTAVAAGDRVSATFDDLGRQVVTPIQVRDLRATAYVTLTNGTETTLLAGAASTFHDLIYVMGANNSDVAVTVDLRCGTGGSILKTIRIPANGTAGVSLDMPFPMSEAAQAWTADMADITGTTVYLTALFTKEV